MTNKQKLLVVRQTYASMKDSVFAELIGAINNMKMGAYVNVKTTPLELNFSNGSQVLFKGADDETKLLSISGVDKVWIEEASDITQDMFNQLELRLRGGGLKKQFYLTFNPISETHWLKREFFDNPKEDCFVLHTTYLDNRFLDDNYINTLLDMKERNYEKYRVYALGQWGVLGKPVFENWEVRDDVAQEAQGVDIHGLDFGYGGSDPTAFVYAKVDEEARTVYILQEIYNSSLLLDDIVEEITKLGHRRAQIKADSANKTFLRELQQKGLRRLVGAQKGPDSVAAGIVKLQGYNIVIDSSCVNTALEFEQYSYTKDKRTGQYLDKPIDDYNHIIDALRYAMEDVGRRANRNRGLTKAMLGL